MRERSWGGSSGGGRTGAGPAGPLVSHLPEVVLAAKGQHALRRQELHSAQGEVASAGRGTPCQAQTHVQAGQRSSAACVSRQQRSPARARHTSGGARQRPHLQPDLPRLLVGRQALRLVAPKVGGVQPLGRQLVHLRTG